MYTDFFFHFDDFRMFFIENKYKNPFEAVEILYYFG